MVDGLFFSGNLPSENNNTYIYIIIIIIVFVLISKSERSTEIIIVIIMDGLDIKRLFFLIFFSKNDLLSICTATAAAALNKISVLLYAF